MKTVKINYARVDDYFDKKQNLIYDILKNHGYDVQISDEPDYIICDALGAEYYDIANIPRFGSCVPAKTTSRILI